MSQDDTADPAPAAAVLDAIDYSAPEPPANWSHPKGLYHRLHRQATEIATLRGKVAELEPTGAALVTERAARADLDRRLALTRVGIDDDDVSSIAQARYEAATAGQPEPPKFADWVKDGGKADKILGKFYASVATPPAATDKRPEPGLTPPNGAPSATNASYTNEDLARIRGANGGRLPKDVRAAVEAELVRAGRNPFFAV